MIRVTKVKTIQSGNGATRMVVKLMDVDAPKVNAVEADLDLQVRPGMTAAELLARIDEVRNVTMIVGGLVVPDTPAWIVPDVTDDDVEAIRAEGLPSGSVIGVDMGSTDGDCTVMAHLDYNGNVVVDSMISAPDLERGGESLSDNVEDAEVSD